MIGTLRRLVRRSTVYGLTALVVAALVAGCGGGGKQASSGGTIKVGVLLPLTGDFSFFGKIFENAMKLRFQQAHYRIGGKKVSLVIKDDANDLTTAQAKVREMVENDHVAMLLGPFNSAITSGLAPYLKARKVPTVVWESTPYEVAQSGWIFCPQGSLAEISYPAGKYASEEMGVHTASLLAPDYIAGWRIAAGFAQGFKEGGGKIIQTQWPPLTATDFSSNISNLKNADAVVSWFPATQVTFLTQELAVKGQTKNVLAYGNGLSDDQMAQVGSKVGSKVQGIVTSIQYVSTLNTPASKKFAQAIKQTSGHLPIVQNDEAAYEDASLVVEALKATGGDTNPDKLRQAIYNLKIDTPAGPLRIDKSGFGIRTFYIVRVEKRGGKLTWGVVKSYPNVGPIAKPLSKGQV